MLGALALFAAIAITVAVPAVYFVVAYSNSAETLSFKSRLNAARVAQYIYTHDVMWQYQQLRLEELIQLPETGEQPIRQKIYNGRWRARARMGRGSARAGLGAARADRRRRFDRRQPRGRDEPAQSPARHRLCRRPQHAARLRRLWRGSRVSVARARPNARRVAKERTGSGRTEQASGRRAVEHVAGPGDVRRVGTSGSVQPALHRHVWPIARDRQAGPQHSGRSRPSRGDRRLCRRRGRGLSGQYLWPPSAKANPSAGSRICRMAGSSKS